MGEAESKTILILKKHLARYAIVDVAAALDELADADHPRSPNAVGSFMERYLATRPTVEVLWEPEWRAEWQVDQLLRREERMPTDEERLVRTKPEPDPQPAPKPITRREPSKAERVRAELSGRHLRSVS